MSELHDVDRRVAVLEQIAKDSAAALADIRTEMRGMRGDFQLLRTEMRGDIQGLRTEIQQLRGQLHDDFRWLLRVIIGGFVGVLGLLGHSMHWF